MDTSPGQSSLLWTRLIRAFAWISLLAAFIIGQIAAQPDYEALLVKALPDLKMFRFAQNTNVMPVVYVVADDAANGLVSSGTGVGDKVVIMGHGEGYGGPLVVGVRATRTEEHGVINEIVILNERETPSYIKRLHKKKFFRQFAGKPIINDFIVGNDIDAVSGATVSSVAFTTAVREAVHLGAEQHLGLEKTWGEKEWDIGLDELTLVALFGLALVASYRRDQLGKKVRLLLPFAALVFVGYHTNTSISLGGLAGILMGYVPSARDHTLWWIMMGGTLGAVFFLGRNIYCDKLCPFSTMQTILQKISGIRIRMNPRMQRQARSIILFLSWLALLLIFLSTHPSMGSYEPFSMMFSLDGVGVQWYILPAALFGSFFIPSFWCRMFCPVGYYLNEMVRTRRSLLQRFKDDDAKRPKPVSVSGGVAARVRREKKSWQMQVSAVLTVFMLLLIGAYFVQGALHVKEAKPVKVAIERLAADRADSVEGDSGN
jgi:Na+-translocating ferredoxin:NAD+ oxidoreductase RnfG subunit